MTSSLVAILLLLLPVTQTPARYTMEDLAALMEQESWEELLAHLHDIAPSKRKGKWLRWAEQAAMHELEAASKAVEPMQAVAVADRLLKSVTPLKKSKKFMLKRAEVGLLGFKTCISALSTGVAQPATVATSVGGSSFRTRVANRVEVDRANRAAARAADRKMQESAAQQCLKVARAFVALDPNNRDLQFRLGQQARAGWQLPTLEFFSAAVGKGNKVYCADKHLRKSVFMALGYDSEPGRKALALATTACWPQLKGEIMETFYTSGRGSRRTKALCPALLKKRVLSSFQKVYCDDAIQ